MYRSHTTPGRKLPPLILHPFADAAGAGKLAEASHATLVLRGLLPDERGTARQLEQRMLTGRYCEIVMLYYLGKDLERWAAQCVDFCERTPDLVDRAYRVESFRAFLIDEAPADVRAKLETWGVQEYAAIFSRAFGMHAVFQTLPARDQLTPDFVRYYHHFADYAFLCRQQLESWPRIDGSQFDFDLYASGEYARMLEQEWESQPE